MPANSTSTINRDYGDKAIQSSVLDPSKRAPETFRELKDAVLSHLSAAAQREVGPDLLAPPADGLPMGDEAFEALEDAKPKIEAPKADMRWLDRARNAWDTSNTFFDSYVRPKLQDSIKAYHNDHPASSHLATAEKDWTSKTYRPKIREIINKHEAGCDLAFFSNTDVVSIEAENPNDKEEVLAAAIKKAILQYRLTKTIPWYELTIMAFQDAEVAGLCCGHYYWISVENPPGSAKRFKVDKPVVELIPLENVRFDPSADPYDIVRSSPYFIVQKPMYIGDVKEKIESGYFNPVSDDELRAAAAVNSSGSVRQTRYHGAEDPANATPQEFTDYMIIMIQEHMHRINGEEFIWYTIGDNTKLLKDPVPLEDVYWTGERPYVIGSTVLEAHNAYPMSVPQLLMDLANENNELANHRLNTMKMNLNPHFIVKEGEDIDLMALSMNAPGTSVYASDPEKDVRVITTECDMSATGAEVEKLNAEMDSIGNNFSQQSVMAGRSPSADPMTAKGMEMFSSMINMGLEHSLRIFAGTYVVKMLRGIDKLISKYETDETIFALVGKQAEIKKYGVDEITNDMLDRDLVININVGMNNTDPMLKQRKLITAISTLENLYRSPVAIAFDMKEITKEVLSLNGYGDGIRFLNQQVDGGQLSMMQRSMMLQKKVMDKETEQMVRLVIAKGKNETALAIAALKEEGDRAEAVFNTAFEAATAPIQPISQQPPQGAPGASPVPQGQPNPSPAPQPGGPGV